MMKRIALVVILGLLFNPCLSYAQDSTAVKDLKEEKQLKFQQYFFKALSEKSIKNYQKAIENLELCNEILPENVSVFFEFSKNYLLLNKPIDARLYINKALEKDPEDLWMLDHLVQIYKKERDYKAAIAVQKKIVAQNPKAKAALIRLLYLNRDFQEAIALLDELEKEKGLPKNLQYLKASLAFRKGPATKKKDNDLKSMVATFDGGDSSFSLLKKILDKANQEDVSIFHKYSEKAIDLFPAQPYTYLMRGKSLENQKKYQESISMLESGIDFVIDNPSLEAQFCEALAKAYDQLGNASKAEEYRNKAKKLKAIK